MKYWEIQLQTYQQTCVQKIQYCLHRTHNGKTAKDISVDTGIPLYQVMNLLEQLNSKDLVYKQKGKWFPES